MEFFMRKRILCILFTFFTVEVFAQDSKPVTTYGDLYMTDQKNDTEGPRRISIGGGVDTANPLRNIYNVQIAYSYELYDYIELGVIAKKFSSSTTGLKDRVDQEFDLIGLQVEGQKPEWASYFSFSVVPIKGRVNFFRKQTIPVALAVSVGPGVRRTSEGGNLSGWFWSVQNRFYINARYSLELNFTQEIEAAFASRDKVTRSQLNVLLGRTF
jgi:hypothetical protein